MSPIPPVITPEPVVEEPDHPVDCTGNIGRELGLEHCGGGAVGFATVNFKLGDVVKIALGGVRDYFCQPHPNETGNYPCDEHTAPLAEVSPAERLVGGLDPPLVDLKSSGVGYIPELNPDLSPSGSGEDITFIGLKGAVDFKNTRVKGSLGPGIIVARHTDPVQGPLVSVGPYFELEAGAVALGDGLDIGLGAVGYLTFKDPLANLPTPTYDGPPLAPAPEPTAEPTATPTPTGTGTTTAPATPLAPRPTATPVRPDPSLSSVAPASPTPTVTDTPTTVIEVPATVQPGPSGTPAPTPTGTSTVVTPPTPAGLTPADVTPVDEPPLTPVTQPPVAPVADLPEVRIPDSTILDPVTHEVVGTCRDGACGLNQRTAPSLDAPVLGAVLEGHQLQIVCQARGDTVSNGHASSNIWNKLSDGTWVSDFYTDTPNIGEFSDPIPRCT